MTDQKDAAPAQQQKMSKSKFSIGTVAVNEEATVNSIKADNGHDPVGWNMAGGCDAHALSGIKGGDGECDDVMDELADIEIPLHLEPADVMASSDPSITRADEGAPSLANGWDENAVISCFELAIQSHSMRHDELVGRGEEAGRVSWEPGPNVSPMVTSTSLDDESGGERIDTRVKDHGNFSSLDGGEPEKDERWRPRPVPLPGWAVDPAYAAAHLDRSAEENADIQHLASKG